MVCAYAMVYVTLSDYGLNLNSIDRETCPGLLIRFAVSDLCIPSENIGTGRGLQDIGSRHLEHLGIWQMEKVNDAQLLL